MATPDDRKRAAKKRLPKQGRAAAYFSTVGNKPSYGTATPPPVSVRLDDDTLADVAAFGNDRGLNLSDSVRRLVRLGLDATSKEHPDDQDDHHAQA